MLGHGTGALEGVDISVDGKVRSSVRGKTGRGFYCFKVEAVYDDKGRFDLFATLKGVMSRAKIGGCYRDLAEILPDLFKFGFLLGVELAFPG